MGFFISPAHGVVPDTITVLGIPLVLTYLICGIPFGKILSKFLCHVDIQSVGSGNIGTTNALRAGGPKVAILTLACDLLKGFGCVMVIRAMVCSTYNVPFDTALTTMPQHMPGAEIWIALGCLVALCGHIFTPYLHFHGGKGIATGVGVLFALDWHLALVHLAIFIVIVAITKYVSLGSIVTAALVGVTTCLFFPATTIAFKVIMAGMGLLVVWAHRSNIKKLLHGHESKLSFTKRVTKLDDAA